MAERRLHDRRILVVEDEYLLAMDLEERLAEAGAIVVGPAPRVTAALALIEQTASLDGAVLDVNLGGELVFPVADELMAKGIPFLLATGYSGDEIPERYALIPRLTKPAAPQDIMSELAQTLTR